MTEDKGYKNILKTTFLFGFVQVFNILVKLIPNKIAAILMGTEGVGIIGLFNNSIGMIINGAGLGVSQSAVKDISEANAINNKEKFSESISLVNKLLWGTALFGYWSGYTLRRAAIYIERDATVTSISHS